jgi:hypothetical protein
MISSVISSPGGAIQEIRHFLSPEVSIQVKWYVFQYRRWMYVIIGSHFVPLEGKFLLIALVIVRITLNVIVRQMLLNVR